MVSERKPGMMGGPPGAANKRHKADGMPPGHGHMPPQQRYPQQGYGGPPGYMGWQGQYPGHGPPPPHGWQGAPGQAPPGMYPPQRGGPPMTPERAGNWSGYRGPPPPHQAPPPGSAGKGQPPPPHGGKPVAKGKDGAPMPSQQYGGAPGAGWSGTGPQWGGPQWQGGPPPPGGWHGGPHPPPQMHQQGHYQNGWSGASQTPPRRPRASPEMMNRGMMGPNGYPPGSGPGVCGPVGMDSPDNLYVTSRGVGVGTGMHDDDHSSKNGLSDKDKGRGSYKCGRCGVPKKGHVCPYQPKVKRRSGEPAPEMKSAAIQVEMDEFMTLRRLNIRIQGFPESYATDPTMSEMVVGEPRPMPRTGMLPTPDGPMMGCPPEAPRSSPHPSSMPGTVLGGAPLPETAKA